MDSSECPDGLGSIRMGDFFVIFESVPDPRDINARHDLREILFIALAAMLCGAESCVEIAQFGIEKTDLLRSILELKHGSPSHDTFSRVLRVLDPVALENAFIRFMEAFRRALGPDVGQSILAVDGKSLKRAYEKGRAHMPPMMVSVWGVTMRMTFAQTEAGEGGEAEAAVKLLKSISLKSCVVTADAIHCDRRVVETVKHRGGDYVIALKRNQRNLLASVAALFDAAGPRARSAETSETGHGRQERRSIVVIPAPGLANEHDFKGLVAAARVIRERTIDGKTSYREHYYIVSRRFPPADLLEIIRSHWDIENGCHWQQDVVFHEDLARNRKKNGPRNLALLRRLTANILKMTPDKASTRVKRLKAAWSQDFFLHALTHMR
jgi:predicted transposase YbfD/YdcC